MQAVILSPEGYATPDGVALSTTTSLQARYRRQDNPCRKPETNRNVSRHNPRTKKQRVPDTALIRPR